MRKNVNALSLFKRIFNSKSKISKSNRKRNYLSTTRKDIINNESDIININEFDI